MFLSASAHLPLRSNLVRFGIVRRTIFNAATPSGLRSARLLSGEFTQTWLGCKVATC